jgi:hypothetical protein
MRTSAGKAAPISDSIALTTATGTGQERWASLEKADFQNGESIAFSPRQLRQFTCWMSTPQRQTASQSLNKSMRTAAVPSRREMMRETNPQTPFSTSTIVMNRHTEKDSSRGGCLPSRQPPEPVNGFLH